MLTYQKYPFQLASLTQLYLGGILSPWEHRTRLCRAHAGWSMYTGHVCAPSAVPRHEQGNPLLRLPGNISCYGANCVRRRPVLCHPADCNSEEETATSEKHKLIAFYPTWTALFLREEKMIVNFIALFIVEGRNEIKIKMKESQKNKIQYGGLFKVGRKWGCSWNSSINGFYKYQRYAYHDNINVQTFSMSVSYVQTDWC